ncbi:MAG: corrinoid protein [Deferrisomatales bacterium]|nr:corrinoid protein [Deferrisomatales bacterium]
MSDYVQRVYSAVNERRPKEIQSLVREAIDAGTDVGRIMNEGLIAAMDEVGRQFAEGEIFVPEMLVSAHTMKLGLEVVKPLLKGDAAASKGTVILGTVKGDLHDIGKNVVAMMLEGAGFHVIDLGVDLTVEKVVDKVKELEPDIVGLSALLTTTMPEMKNVISALETAGLRGKVKVMVGGAPVDARFAAQIGADGHGKDAAEAVSLARRLVAVD